MFWLGRVLCNSNLHNTTRTCIMIKCVSIHRGGVHPFFSGKVTFQFQSRVHSARVTGMRGDAPFTGQAYLETKGIV